MVSPAEMSFPGTLTTSLNQTLIINKKNLKIKITNAAIQETPSPDLILKKYFYQILIQKNIFGNFVKSTGVHEGVQISRLGVP